MSPSTRQALRKSVNNMSDPEKVPLLEPSNNVKELEATGDEKLQSRYRNNGRDSKSSYSNTQTIIRMRLRPGPNGPRLSFLTVFKEGTKKKSGFQKIRSHVENTNPEEKRHDWMGRLRPKPHRCVS
ncbi:uncharacterized protein N7473_001569 [Penicillium subrubescens]|uniref:uncharacterized protein n=1 Tax=Penicillium subrubescens TaxID=1316194 RepID=UPI0025458F6B|nr:uncharacterized protein N7473_001569 [Penicillium subrubescens]KAJ5904653.1 hypothetical protein N7473_001569 [Penicillium subrubescens]